MNVIFLGVGQLLGQYSFVIKKFCYRWFCMCSLLYLAVKRALIIWKPTYAAAYIFWLVSNLGWRRYIVNYFRYYRGMLSFALRWIFIGVSLYIFSQKFNFDGFCDTIFGLFSQPVMSEKGYLAYAVLVSCLLVWFVLAMIVLCFKSVRAMLKPYWDRIVVLNIIIFMVLLSLFSKVARAKFGIRVWYPNERIYGGRLGFEFWDSDWWKGIF